MHPLKVRPGDRFRGILVPKDYSLSDDGKIICLTCHTAHGPGRSAVRVHALQQPDDSEPSPDSPPGYKTFFLRRTDPGALGFDALCGGCHKAP
jgi:cytochrome c peroxidase